MRGTTVAQLRERLAGEDGQAAVVIYADAVGEWVDIPPYNERQAAVCGYFTVADIGVGNGLAVIVMGAEAAL